VSILSDLLKRYRERKGLKQEDLVDELRGFSDRFTALSVVTLSRWENEVTRPGIQKRQALLKFFYRQGCFEHPQCRSRIRDRYAALHQALERSFERPFRHFIGNYPETEGLHYELIPLREHPERELCIEHIVEIERHGRPEGADTSCSFTAERLARWSEHPSTYAYVCKSSHQHAGHQLMIKLPTSVVRDTVLHRREYLDFDDGELCAEEEPGSYLILGLYARSPRVSALLNTLHYQFLAERMNRIDEIAIFSRREDTLSMTRDYGIRIAAQGMEPDGRPWHGLSAALPDILFTEGIVEAIF